MAEKKEITKVDIPLKIGDTQYLKKRLPETDVVLHSVALARRLQSDAFQ